MRIKDVVTGLVVVVSLAFAATSSADDRWGLEEGKLELKSAGPLAFGPEGILFVGDTTAAAVVAIATGDKAGAPSAEVKVEALGKKLASLLGVGEKNVKINDLAVNPISGNVYLSVRVRGAAAAPAIVRIDANGKLSKVSLSKVAFSRAALPNTRKDAQASDESITDLAYVEGKVFVSGLTKASSPSNIRELAFPFADSDQGTSIEIYHGAHGRYEDYAPVRVFVPFNVGGKPSLLAGFTCTPLVSFPLSGLKAGKKVRGKTVAELGNRNHPLDMIVYKKDGKDFLLMANSARGVMKISTENIGSRKSITTKVVGGGKAGQPYETIKDLKGVVQLDRLNDTSAVVLVKTAGSFNLKTIPLP